MKFIFIDIDGTLYSSKTNGVLPSSIEAIKKTKEKGNKVFLCTGRSLSECKLFLGWDVDGFVFASGGLIYADKKRIYENPFSSGQVSELTSLLNGSNVGYSLAGYAGAYGDKKGMEKLHHYFSPSAKNFDELKSIIENNGMYPIELWHEEDRITKICWFADTEEELMSVANLIPDGYAFAITAREEGFVCGDIIKKECNKFTGIKHIVSHYGGSLEETVGIGDSNNDYEMILNCNVGIAMGNAFEGIKEIADHVTDDILEDGLYNAFVRFELI